MGGNFKSRLLWTYGDNSASVWVINTDGSKTIMSTMPPPLTAASYSFS